MEINNLETGSDAALKGEVNNILDAEDLDNIASENQSKGEQEGKESFEKILKDYIVPLGLIATGFIIIFSLLLPRINSIIEEFNQINELQTTYQDYVNQQNTRQSLAQVTNQQQATIATIDELIPQRDTAVVDFSEEIRDRAADFDLRINDTKVRESVVVNSNSALSVSGGSTGAGAAAAQQGGTGGLTGAEARAPVEAQLDLVELPAEFSLTGSFENITDFLSSFYSSGDDFIIVKEMELRRRLETDSTELEDEESDSSVSDDADQSFFSADESITEWNMSVVLVKYQFRITGDQTTGLENYYFTIPDTARADEQVLNFIRENYQDPSE